jgi:hypothetical protein
LLQFDGKMPNLALMRIAAHHACDDVELRQPQTMDALQPELWDGFDYVYGSLIFQKSRPMAEHALSVYPNIVLGGTGWDLTTTLEAHRIRGKLDYSIYPNYPHSIGYTQRGCRFACPFCVVSKKEGKNRSVANIANIWRGEPYPRNIILLDNDFFGQTEWKERIAEIRAENFRVSFNQGINVRTIDDEVAAALSSVKYYDGKFRARRIYTAWDNSKDEKSLMSGLKALVRHGIKPAHIMVYMLIGYWPKETPTDWEYRRQRLREFGAMPYPMPYVRNEQTVGFQRWVVGAYDKRVSWNDWMAAGYDPYRLSGSRKPATL